MSNFNIETVGPLYQNHIVRKTNIAVYLKTFLKEQPENFLPNTPTSHKMLKQILNLMLNIAAGITPIKTTTGMSCIMFLIGESITYSSG